MAARLHTAWRVLLIGAGAYLDNRTHGGSTPLFEAAYNGHVDVISVLLLRAKANPLLTTRSASGGTPSSHWTWRRNTGTPDVVRELIEQVGITARGGASGGVHALSLAAQKQHVDIMAI